MCEPATALAATSLAIGIGGTVAGASAQGSQARAQGRFQNKRYLENAESALQSYRTAVDAVSLRDEQESMAATAAAESNSRQGISQRSRAAVMAAAAGVSGNSLNAAMNQFSAFEFQNDFNVWRNREWQRAQLRRELEGVRAGTQSNISAATPSPLQGVNYAAMAFQLGGAALDSARVYKEFSKP